ncbi:MAG: hypothetical protein ACLGPM_10630 [Acidobacteriota bacterium]
MSTYLESLIDRYIPKGLLIDANLALLYLVGSFDQRLLGDGKYNKLSKYILEDYELLLRLKKLFSKAVTTPHVLTEVSNLTNDLPERTKSECLKKFYETFVEIDELTIPSMEAAKRPEFHFLGLTDTALSLVCAEFLIVTDDARLVKKLNELGLEALNFNHLRMSYLLPA